MEEEVYLNKEIKIQGSKVFVFCLMSNRLKFQQILCVVCCRTNSKFQNQKRTWHNMGYSRSNDQTSQLLAIMTTSTLDKLA